MFDADTGELVYSLKYDKMPASKWHLLADARPYTDWFLASDFYAGTIYAVAEDGTIFDLRKQQPAPFTTRELTPKGDDYVDVCDKCGVHSFAGPIQHQQHCSRARTKAAAPPRQGVP
jgi:hypothetical protein